MLIELSRLERNSKIQALATSKENQKFTEYYDYYNGDHFVKSDYYQSDYGRKNHFNVFTRSGLPVFDQKTTEEKTMVHSNWCRVVVDTIADYARGVNEDVQVVCDNAQDELHKIWQKNNINTLTHEVSVETGIFGKSYLKLRQRDKGEKIEVFTIDPGGVHLVKNPITQDVEAAIYFFGISAEDAKRTWPTLNIGNGKEVYYAEEWTKDKLYKFVDGLQVNEIGELGVKDGNPYGFIPFYEVKADDFSASDIADVVPLNDELNVTLTYNSEVIKYHAFPIYSPDGAYTGNNIIPEEALKDVKISPRTMLNFPAKRIGGEGPAETVIQYIEKLQQQISIVSAVPLKLLTAELDGSLSGVALQRLMSGVIKKAEQRRNYIKSAYQQISRDMLLLLGKEDEEVDVIFPEIIKTDNGERLDEAIKKQTLGISKDTIFEELGYDYDEEEKKRQEEFDNSLERRIIDEQQAISETGSRVPKKGNEAQRDEAGRDNQTA